MPIEVRRAVTKDADAIREVNERAIRGSAASMYSAEQIEAWAAGASVEAATCMIDQTVAFVAIDGDRVVGFANLVVETGDVDQLYVDPTVGGRGVARQLHEAVEREAASHGLDALTATASRRAEPAFARFGYQLVRHETRGFNGESFAVARMAKRLASLTLRPLQLDDEPEFVAAHHAMQADDFTFGLGYEPGMPWSTYVETLQRWTSGLDLPAGFVSNTFVVACVDNEIVGRASIRHELNEFLAHEAGHIGYCVLAPHRRRGYATEILQQSLVIARAAGVDRVLVTCDDDNVGSAVVIVRCGGVLDSVVDSIESGRPTRRYWIS